jgi:hypothetical protein
MRFALLVIGVLVMGCDRGRDNLSPVVPTDAQVKAILEIEDKLKDAHPYTDTDARTYIENLKREGYRCRAQYRGSYSFDKYAQPESSTVPWVVCVQSPAKVEPCAEVSVGMDFPAMKNADLRSLIEKLPALSVVQPGFVCEVIATSADAEKRIAVAKDQGRIVPLD